MVPLDSPSEEDDEVALQRVFEEGQMPLTKGFSAFTDLSPNTPKDPPSATPSPTLIQTHSAFNSRLMNLDMSPMEGLPPGYALPPVPTGKSLINAELTESEGVPPNPMTVPVTTTATGAASKHPRFNPHEHQEPQDPSES
jgi:hypothetical protein